MGKSIVAIVGRPNVGKSTLFNRICRKRSAIVDFEEGVTRDRKYEDAEWNGYVFTVVDTGGIIPYSENDLDRAVKLQAEIAIEQSDLVIFLVDAKVGTTDIDIEIAKTLYSKKEKVLLTANKVDNEKDELEIYDFLQLGFGEAFPISANQGRNTGNFLDEVVKYIEKNTDEFIDDSIKIAVIGKPNVGKSLLTNKLTGVSDNIVTNIPGTTRDSIDTVIKYKEKKFTFIDTAGLRRKQRIKYGVEYFSNMRTISSIERSDLVLLMLDAASEISNQDKKIASHAVRRYKDIIIVFNKWDLIEKDNHTIGRYIDRIKEEFPFLQYSPVMFVSALTGQRVNLILDKILEVYQESSKRISTSELNRFLEKTTSKFSPSHSSGKHSKIFYSTQIKTNPPTFVFFCNNPKLITTHYRRYLANQLRSEYKFTGATIRIFYRGRDESNF